MLGIDHQPLCEIPNSAVQIPRLSRDADNQTGHDTLARMQSIQEAIELLNGAASALVSGSPHIWRIINNARKHLDRELATIMLEYNIKDREY